MSVARIDIPTDDEYDAAIEALIAMYGSDADPFVSLIETAKQEETVHTTDNQANECADDCMGCFTERLADAITRVANGGEVIDRQRVPLPGKAALAVLVEAEADRDRARDIAVALEQENAKLRAQMAAVEKFAAARAEYITAINNCNPDNSADYWRWQGHAEGRRQLSQTLGLPVGWPAGYEGGEAP